MATTTDTAIQARLYGPGLAPAGEVARLGFVGDALCLAHPSGAQCIDASRLALRRAGFDERGLELAWDDARGTWAAQVLEPAAVAELCARLPQPLRTALAQVSRSQARQHVGRGLAWGLIALVGAAPLLALAALLAFADPLAGWVSRRLPIEHEVRLGEASFASLSARLTRIAPGAATRAVEALGARLSAGSAYSYRFHLVEDPAVNAYALPGGIVVVHSGLLQATRTPEELAGVLAHEIQHVELRHGLEGLIKQAGLSLGWAFLTGDWGGSVAGEAARELLGLRFSRAAEREADDRGFERLVRSGIDPSGMARFFETLAEHVPETGHSMPALLSTHPASAERSAQLYQRLATLSGRRFEALAYGNWPPPMRSEAH